MIKKLSLFNILLTLVFLLFLFLKLYDYPSRIFVESDNSRDAQVAYYAVLSKQVPQIGQFSSSGPFFYGPIWYWFLSILTILPFGALTPWYMTTFLSFVFFLILFYIGKNINSKWLSLVILSIYSVSPLFMNISHSIWNPIAVPYLVLLQILIYLKYIDTKKPVYLYLIFLCVATAITIHLQSLLMFPILLVSIFTYRVKLRQIFISIVSFLIPFIPLVWFDLRFNFFNFRNFYQYITVDQYKIWVPNRWLFFLRDYLPNIWGEIIGGTYLTGILTITIFVIVFLLINRVIKNKKIFLLSLIFFFQLILYRYYRGERFIYLSFFAMPYILILSSWAIFLLIKKVKIIGIIVLLILMMLSVEKVYKNTNLDNLKYTQVLRVKNELYEAYENSNFSIYGCPSTKGNLISHPLAYFLSRDGRNSKDGIKIGVCMSRRDKKPLWQKLSVEELENNKEKWTRKDTKQVHNETTQWWVENPPVL